MDTMTPTPAQVALAETVRSRSAYKRTMATDPGALDLAARNVMSTDSHSVAVMKSVSAVCAEQNCNSEDAIVGALELVTE